MKQLFSMYQEFIEIFKVDKTDIFGKDNQLKTWDLCSAGFYLTLYDDLGPVWFLSVHTLQIFL